MTFFILSCIASSLGLIILCILSALGYGDVAVTLNLTEPFLTR